MDRMMISTTTSTISASASASSSSSTAIMIARRNMERNLMLEEQRKVRLHDIALKSLQHDAFNFGKFVPRQQRLKKQVIMASITSQKPMPFLNYIDDNLDWDEIIEPPFIPQIYRNDSDVIMALTNLDDFDYDCDEFQNLLLGNDLKSTKNFMLEFCSKFPLAINVANILLRDDIELALMAISKDPKAYEYVSTALQNSIQVIIHGLCSSSSTTTSTDNINNNNNNNNDKPPNPTTNPYVYEAFCKYVNTDNDEIRNNKQVVLALLEAGGKPNVRYRDILCEFSEEVRADYDVIKKAVSIDGLMLEDADDKLRDHPTIVELAVENNGRSLNYASNNLRLDKDIATTACNQDGEALIYVLEPLFSELAEDDEFMEKSVLCNDGGRMIISCSLDMQSNIDIVLLAMANGLTYDCIPDHKMRSSKEFTLKAIALQPLCYDYLRRRQQHDKDIVRAAILAGYYDAKKASSEDSTLTFLDDIISDSFPELFTERGVFLYLVKNGHKEQYWNKLSMLQLELDEDTQSNDKEYMMDVCQYDGRLWEYCTGELMEDRDIIERCMGTHPLVFEDVSDEFQIENTELALKYIQKVEIPDLPHAVLRQNKQIALAYIPKESEGLDLWEDLSLYREDEDIVKAIVVKTPEQMNYSHSDLQGNRRFCLSIIRQNGLTIKYMKNVLIQDFEFQVAAIANNVRVVDIASGNESIFFSALGGGSAGGAGGGGGDNNDIGGEPLFDVLVFAQSVRERLELHEVFTNDILCAMDVPAIRRRRRQGRRNHTTSEEEDDDGVDNDAASNTDTADEATSATLNDLVQHVSETSLLSALFGFDDGLLALSQALSAPEADHNIFDPQPTATITTTQANSNRNNSTRNITSCSLPLLNLGKETGTALKTLIADFVGLPRGTELHELRMASVNLTIRGY